MSQFCEIRAVLPAREVNCTAMRQCSYIGIVFNPTVVESNKEFITKSLTGMPKRVSPAQFLIRLEWKGECHEN